MLTLAAERLLHHEDQNLERNTDLLAIQSVCYLHECIYTCVSVCKSASKTWKVIRKTLQIIYRVIGGVGIGLN